MITKRHAHESLLTSYNGVITLTDHNKGEGHLRLEGVGPSRYVTVPAPPGQPHWYSRGSYEYDQYRIVGKASDEYEWCFGLRVCEDGHIRPSSIKSATIFPTKEAAVEMAEKWLSEGGPSLALEHPQDTAARKRNERSGYIYSKIQRQLSSLTDADLIRLSEAATKLIAKREENAAKEIAKAAEKARKAAEKAKAAAEKEAKKKAAAEAKAQKAAAAAAKKALAEQKKAEAAAKKAAKEAKNQPTALSA